MKRKRIVQSFLAGFCAVVLCAGAVMGPVTASGSTPDVPAEESESETEYDEENEAEEQSLDAAEETGDPAVEPEKKEEKDGDNEEKTSDALTKENAAEEDTKDTDSDETAGKKSDSDGTRTGNTNSVDSEKNAAKIQSPDESTKTSEETSDTSKSQGDFADGIPVDEEGLPKRGLLLDLQMDDDPGDVPAPILFIKANPCGKKEHNTQPDNYMSSALGCAEYVFERNPGEAKYRLVNQYETEKTANRDRTRTSVPLRGNDYIKTAIESYSDTADLWHSFTAKPSEDGKERIFALVPLAIVNGVFYGASDQYCFRYEAALADEQNWEMTDGSRISGGYIVRGKGESEHRGKTVERRTVHFKRKTGGQEIRLNDLWNYNGKAETLPEKGLLLTIDAFPEGGMPDELNLHLSCPEKFENGEGGFGFSSESEYRSSEMQKWQCQITGKGGTRLLIQNFRRATNTNDYDRVSKREVEVSGDGVTLDLNALDVEAGDIISVLPYTLNWDSVFEVKAPNRQLPVSRFFHFQYDISCTRSNLTAKSSDDTRLRVQDERHVAGAEPVADDGDYLQQVSIAVTNSETGEDSCGMQTKSNIPNYGFFVLRKENQNWAETWPTVKIIPQKTGGEKSVFYAAEWYKKNGDGYTRVYAEIAEVVHSATVLCGDMWEKKNTADFCVIRRIRYPGEYIARDSRDIFRAAGSGYEVKDSAGNVRYPQSGKDTIQLYTEGGDRFDGDDGSIWMKDCTSWNSADPETWEKNPGKLHSKKESILRGISFQLDLSNVEERAITARIDENEKSHFLIKTEKTEDGLPPHSLVILNRIKGKGTEKGVEYNVSLGMPVGILSYTDQRQLLKQGRVQEAFEVADEKQMASCHLYKRTEEGKWEKIEQHDASDWVNSGSNSFYHVELSDTYSYSVHAHLKDNEAIVITPEIDSYELNYSVDMYSHSEYDVLPDQCDIPQGCTHLTRHYFKGTLLHDDPETVANQTTLVITTALKNADAGEKDQASALPKTKVKALKVNLFDYDFGKEHDFVLGDQLQTFRFRYDPKNVRDTDVNMWHAGACTDILQKKLDENGLPVFRYGTPFESAGVGLFDDRSVSEKVNGGTKKAYPDVDFDFIYNEKDQSYSYNSALNAACFDEKDGHVREYDRTLGIDGWEAKGAGFFPFNNFKQKGVWGTADKKNKGTYLIDQANDMNYHFGLSTTQTFEIPENGTINGKNLKFHFSGDDDAWVFVDGQLVLDMGGIHEAVQGDIDFTNGTWCVTADQNSPWNTFGNDYTAPVVSQGKLSEKLSDFPSDGTAPGSKDGAWGKGTKHTFSFFYLERGGTLSDLSMNFNLPTVEEEPKTTFIRTGQKGIYGMQILAGVLITGAFLGIRKKYKFARSHADGYDKTALENIGKDF